MATTKTPPDLLRTQAIIKLGATNAHAKRQFPKVGSNDHPTPWDLVHERINELLYDLEELPPS